MKTMSKQIELTNREIRRIVPILSERYKASNNLFEISEIKGVLQKLGENVEDWTPDYADLQELTN